MYEKVYQTRLQSPHMILHTIKKIQLFYELGFLF